MKPLIAVIGPGMDMHVVLHIAREHNAVIIVENMEHIKGHGLTEVTSFPIKALPTIEPYKIEVIHKENERGRGKDQYKYRQKHHSK